MPSLGPGLTAPALAEQVAAMARIQPDALRQAIACLPTHDTRDRLAEVTVPTLVSPASSTPRRRPATAGRLAGRSRGPGSWWCPGPATCCRPRRRSR